MSLKVIGAGFGRTGTLSLKFALEQLGFGPCYHMIEVFKNPVCIPWWHAVADGTPDWDKIFDGYNATVDWPSATYYAELAAHYPQAKVTLTERDPEVWFRSTQNTIFPNATPPDTEKPFDQLFRKCVGSLFDQRMRDHDHVIAVYKRHNAEVRERIPKDRLLVYEASRGWAPLCEFLGVPVPDTPMHNVNSTEDFRKRFKEAPRPQN